jgi:dGTPase
VSLADRIAYINHDIEDAIRAGILKESDLPQNAVKVLGIGTSERIHTAIADIYKTSYDKPFVKMSDEVMAATNELRSFMFKGVYEVANKQIQERSERMLTQLFCYFMEHADKLPEPYHTLLNEYDKDRVVCDYLSGMTDRYAITVFENLFIPTNFSLGGVH